MASPGYLESILNTLPAELRKPIVAFVREAFKTLRFGAPESDAVAAENFGGHLVPVTTSATADKEVAVPHALGRTPRLVIPLLATNTVNATIPVFEISQAADSTNVYLSSATQNASFWLYVE